MTSRDVEKKLGIPRKWLDNYAKNHGAHKGKQFDWEAHFSEIENLYKSEKHRKYIKSGKYTKEAKKAKKAGGGELTEEQINEIFGDVEITDIDFSCQSDDEIVKLFEEN